MVLKRFLFPKKIEEHFVYHLRWVVLLNVHFALLEDKALIETFLQLKLLVSYGWRTICYVNNKITKILK